MFAMTSKMRRKKLVGGRRRRAADFRLDGLSTPTPPLSDDTVNQIIATVGVSLSAERREKLTANLADVLEWRTILATSSGAPTASEALIRLKGIKNTTNRLWQQLEISASPAEIWKSDKILRTADIPSVLSSLLSSAAHAWGQEHEPELHRRMEISTNSDSLRVLLAERGIPESSALLETANVYSGIRLRDVIYTLAMLIDWIDAALIQTASKKSNHKAHKKPDHFRWAITLYLAQTYEDVFGSPPTDYENGHWLKFLRKCFRDLYGEVIKKDAARKLWQRAKKYRYLSNSDIQTVHALWQRTKELRQIAGA
jgi:hypothetical protein